LFRRLFLQALERAYEKGKLTFHGASAYLAKPLAFNRLLAGLRTREWWVYAKPPFGGPAQVLSYLGRYTHRVAISNHRLVSCKDGHVTFSWKDYAHGQRQSLMTLNTDEFIRRFLLHVLPRGFQRLRQFGLLANRRRREKLALCRKLLSDAVAHGVTNQPLPPDYQALYETVTGQSLVQCSACHAGKMRLIERLAPLATLLNCPPHSHLTLAAAAQAIDSS
jgi:hypothetical protein